MANEHFFPGEYFSSGLSAPFLGASYAPPPRSGGLDAAAAMAFGLPWGDHQQLPADSSATTAHFDSALSSLVSSPASAAAVAGGGLAHGDGAGGDHDVAIGDLIGRLGSICNGASANDSCYSTPLSSPPRGATPAFRGYAAALETGRLSRVSSSKSLGCAAPAAMALENSEPEMSPRAAGNHAMPDPPPAKGAGSARKRKAPAKGKVKTEPSLPATAATNASPKRPKMAGDENAAATAEEEKPELEPAKDYIHVRARRGQATDSHSLAERVRRERISERMKLLQSLVPGCNKITGKALMLDEIINYVQSLQRQVEFLSMKLSTMNPQPNFDGHYTPSKDMNQMAMSVYPSDDPATAFSYSGSPADPFALATAAHHGQELENTFHPSGGAFSWEQDLQSMVQMGATMAKIPMLSTANRRQ